MASLIKLPTELHLQIFKAVTDLDDLVRLLDSSEQLSDTFRVNFGALIANICIRQFSGNAYAAAKALGAVFSNVNMEARCCMQNPAGVEGFVEGTSRWKTTWRVSDEHSVWVQGMQQAYGPRNALLHLRDLSADVNSFMHMIYQDTGKIYTAARARGIVLLENVVWELQAFVQRCANLKDAFLKGPMPEGSNDFGVVLNSTYSHWYSRLSKRKQRLLTLLLLIAEDADQQLRKHPTHLPSDSLPYLLAYGPETNYARLTQMSPQLEISAHLLHERTRKNPAIIRASDRQRYKNHCRDLYLNRGEDLASKHCWFAEQDAPDRLARIKANVASHLLQHWPAKVATPTEARRLVNGIGRYRDDEVDAMVAKHTLEKHIRLIAIANRNGQGSEDTDAILPDMSNFFNDTVRRWWESMKLERKYGIATRIPVPEGITISGIPDDCYLLKHEGCWRCGRVG